MKKQYFPNAFFPILTMMLVSSISVFSQTTNTWTNVTPAGFNFGEYGGGIIFVNPSKMSDLYIGAGSGTSGVMKSTDYGLSWFQINTLTGHYGFGISPTSPVTILMGSGNGNGSSFRSTDGGATFTTTSSVSGAAADPYDYAVDPYDPTHIIIGFHEIDGIAESSDCGQTFHMISSVAQGTPGWPSGGISWFPFFIDSGMASTTHGRWIAIAQDGASVCLTTNNGASWYIPSSVNGLQHPHGTAEIYQNGSTVFIAGVYGPGQGVYRSTDLGNTWARVDNGSDPEAIVWGTPTHVYAGYGWAIGSLGTQSPNYEVSSQPGVNWIYTSMPAGIDEGVQKVVTTYDGTHYILVGSMWQQGIWRYVENSPPVASFISNLVVTPRSVTNNTAHNVVFTLKANTASGTVTNVSLNLSSLSGPSIAKMLNVSGSTMFSYTYSVPAGLSVGSLTVPIYAQTSTGKYDNWHNFVVNILPYITGIVVTNISVTPSQVSNNRTTSIVFNIKAKDLNGSITNVTLNLSSVAGPSSVKMANISGATSWQYSYSVPSGQAIGQKRILIFVYDNSGNLDTNHSAFISVINGSPRGIRVIYRDATNAITGTWSGNGTLQEVTNLASPAAYEGIKQYRYNYNLNGGWWDGLGLMSDGNGTLNISGATNLMIAYQGPASGNTLYLQLITRTNTAGGKSYSPDVFLPYSATYKLTNIPLSVFVDAGHPADFTRYSELDFGMSGAATGTGTIYFDDIVFKGVNITNMATVPYNLTLSAVTVAPTAITNGKNNIVTVSCTAVASNGNVTQVSVDLSSVGGGSAVPMTNISGNYWRGASTVLSGVSAGSKTLTVKASDNHAENKSASITLAVSSPGPSGIIVTNISATPGVVTNTTSRLVTFNVKAKDIVSGTVTNVSLNLSSLSGPVVKMSAVSGTTLFSYAYTVPAGVTSGIKNIPFIVMDNNGNSDLSHNASVTVIAGITNGISFAASPVITASLTNNKPGLVTVTCTVSATNGTVTMVTVDLSQLGGSASVPMTNIGGNNWRGSYTVSAGITSGTKTLTIVAVNNQSKSRSITASVVVSEVPSNGAVNSFLITPNPLILSGPRMNGPITTITYNADSGDEVDFEIYTILGQLVIKLNGAVGAYGNTPLLQWDGHNDTGKLVSSGIYLIFMRVNGKVTGPAMKFGLLR